MPSIKQTDSGTYVPNIYITPKVRCGYCAAGWEPFEYFAH